LYGHSALKAFEMTSRTTKGFFGRIHLQVLLELSAYYDLSALIVECLGYLTVKIKDIADYVDALREGIAPTKLPKYLFRAGGCYGFFEGKLRSILEYDDLKPEIFQAFREAGNTIAFLRDLSDLVDVSDQTRFINLAPYLGKNVFESKEEFIPSEENLNLVTLANLLTSLADNVTKNPELAISPTLSYNLQEAARRLSTTCASSTGYNSIFHFTLKQVQDTMAHFQLDKKWASAKLHYNDFQANPYIAVEIEQASGFHKIWSALNFLFCMPDGDELKVEKARGIITADDGEFGHGFAIAGCLFVHLMGQRYPFELMDYANHVLNVDAHDKTVNTISTSGSLKGLGQQVGQVDPSLQKATDKFLVTAAEQRQLHSELFVMYQAKIPVKFEITGFSKDVAAHGIVLYHPPAEVIES
jgi:cytoplasmic FMR1 interacting protein